MGRRRITAADLDRIAELRSRGLGAARIARSIGASRGAVNYWLLRHGIDGPRPVRTSRPTADARGSGQARRCFTDDEDRRLLELESRGLSLHAIGRELGRRRCSVQARLMLLARNDRSAEGDR